jgi:hypothetical protein
MIAVRVVWAFFTPGSRKAFTPLRTASLCCCRRCSTSVKAVQPVANTFKSSQKVTTAVAGPGYASWNSTIVESAAYCKPKKRLTPEGALRGKAYQADVLQGQVERSEKTRK